MFKTLDNVNEISCFIEVNNDENTIKFKIQDGPVGESGTNGCQLDDVIAVGKMMLEGLNVDEFRCRENAVAITKLDEALMWLRKRRGDRVRRFVEGTSKP